MTIPAVYETLPLPPRYKTVEAHDSGELQAWAMGYTQFNGEKWFECKPPFGWDERNKRHAYIRGWKAAWYERQEANQ